MIVVAKQETQTSRERQIVKLVEKFCPELFLHSRAGRGLVRIFVPRLRFDRRRYFRWFFHLFNSKPFPPALVITGERNGALELQSGWIPVEIHCLDERLAQKAKALAAAYQKETGFAADVVLEPKRDIDRWTWIFLFFTIICAMMFWRFGLRLLALNFLNNIL